MTNTDTHIKLLKSILGDKTEIKPSEQNNNYYYANEKKFKVDIRNNVVYSDNFYDYFDYIDIDEYRISWAI